MASNYFVRFGNHFTGGGVKLQIGIIFGNFSDSYGLLNAHDSFSRFNLFDQGSGGIVRVKIAHPVEPLEFYEQLNPEVTVKLMRNIDVLLMKNNKTIKQSDIAFFFHVD